MSFDKYLQEARRKVQNTLEEQRLAAEQQLAETEQRQREEQQRELGIRAMPEFQQLIRFATDPLLEEAILGYWEHFRPITTRRRLLGTYQEIPRYYLERTCAFPRLQKYDGDDLGIVKVRLYRDSVDPYSEKADTVERAGRSQRFVGMLYLEFILSVQRRFTFRVLRGSWCEFDGPTRYSFSSFTQFSEVLDLIATSIVTNTPLWKKDGMSFLYDIGLNGEQPI